MGFPLFPIIVRKECFKKSLFLSPPPHWEGSFVRKYDILITSHTIKQMESDVLKTFLTTSKHHLVLESKHLHWHDLELSNHRKNRGFWLKIMYLITGNNCNNILQTQHHLCLNIFFSLQMHYVIWTFVWNWLICVSYRITNIFMIVKMINLRMRWVGLVAYMGENKNVDRVLVGNLEVWDHLGDQGIGGRILFKNGS